MLKPRLIAVALLAASAAAVPVFGASAEPLKPEECKALQAKKLSLLTPTVKAALARGPDWVKEHLHKYEEIEKVRAYLLAEEKVAFRCRTDGVRIPGPRLAPMPDRKPPVPTYVVEGTPQVLAGAYATSFLPLRKPDVVALETASTDAAPEATSETMGPGDGAGDVDSPDETAVAETEPTAESGPSQALADSDKTAPSDNKATQ